MNDSGNGGDRPVTGCCLGCLVFPVMFLILSALFGPVWGFLGSIAIAYLVSGPREDYQIDHRDPP